MFRIVFVVDILNGIAVHAMKGERAKYKPVKSRLCDSSSPPDIISSLAPKEVYIADLNRLQHLGDNFGLIKKMATKVKTMADIGVENMEDIERCLGIADAVILGTETAPLDLIEKAVVRFPDRINVSIDMKNGMVLTKDRNMQLEPEKLVKLLNEYDIRDIIVLELNKVGTGAGIDVDFLKKIVKISTHAILAGGGIKDMNDIHSLKKIGAGGALVATAVHNGSIPVEFIR